MVRAEAPENDTLLTSAQVAGRLGVSVQTVRRWLAVGRLSAVRLGKRCVRIRAAELARFVAERTEGPTVRRAEGVTTDRQPDADR